MTFKNKFLWNILPSLCLLTIGFLAFEFPDFFSQESGYVGYSGTNAFFVLSIRVILYLFWSKLAGIITMLIGCFSIIFSVFKSFDKPKESAINNKDKITQAIIVSALPSIIKKSRNYLEKSKQK